MTLQYRPPTPEDIAYVAANMRDADVLEVAASHGHTPLQALTTSIHESDMAFCAVVDGTPICIFGFACDEDEERAAVWLLGTDDILKHRRLFLRESRRIVGEWAKCFGQMFNWVDRENAVALRWLSWLGFEHVLVKSHGVANQPFVFVSRV